MVDLNDQIFSSTFVSNLLDVAGNFINFNLFFHWQLNNFQVDFMLIEATGII